MRKRNGVRAALLCALAATAAVPASASAASHPVHNDGLTIASTPDPNVAGAGVLIYGQLKGSDVAGQTVHLFHRINPAAQFTLISTTTTNQYGFYEFTRAEGVVVSNRNWYAVGPNGSHSRTIHELVNSTLTMSESASATTTGEAITFAGSVYPAHPDQKVYIQEQSSNSGDSWHTVASGRTNAASAFSIGHAFRTAGDYTLRAYLPADDRNIAGSSDASTLSVQQKQVPSFTINNLGDPDHRRSVRHDHRHAVRTRLDDRAVRRHLGEPLRQDGRGAASRSLPTRRRAATEATASPSRPRTTWCTAWRPPRRRATTRRTCMRRSLTP